MNNKRTFFIALTFLATIVACAVPGVPTASAPVFAPTVDTGRIETMVAETVSAAIVQTEQARPTQTESPTKSAPLPTLTSTPIPTLQPTSTIPAATFTPETADIWTSTLTVQVDGSTIFVDDHAGYQIIAPPAWLIMRINEQEYLDAGQLAEASDANVQQALLNVQKDDPKVLRLYAIDAQDGHIQSGFVSNMKFSWNEKSPISLENEEKFKASAPPLSGGAVPGMEVLSAKISKINEIPVGLIELKLSIKNSSNADVTVFQKLAVFNTPGGQMTITLSTVENLKGTLFPVFDAMLSTIRISAN